MSSLYDVPYLYKKMEINDNTVSLVKKNVNCLRESHCEFSASVVDSFFLSGYSGNIDRKIELLELEAETAMHRHEYMRSCDLFNRAIQQLQILQREGKTDSLEWESRLKYKMAVNHVAMKDESTALKELELIPAAYRDCRSNMLLGKLYMRGNVKRKAHTCFKNVLSQEPMAVEALEALIEISADPKELSALVHESMRRNPDLETVASVWLPVLATALYHRNSGDFENAISKLEILKKLFPNNVYVLNTMARVAMETGRIDEARRWFGQSRSVDPMGMDGADLLGYLLLQAGDDQELNQLTNELLTYNCQHPAGWLLASMFCHLRGDNEKAFFFVEKAKELDPYCQRACYLKGQYFLAQGAAEQAQVEFLHAKNMKSDIFAVLGIVEASLCSNSLKQAVRYAREAVACFPNNPLAHLSMGNVLLKTQRTNAEEALRCFQKALSLYPNCVAAVIACSEVLLEQGQADQALQCIKNSLKSQPSAQLTFLYGRGLAATQQYGESIKQLQISIALFERDGCDATAAMEELEKLEVLLREGDENKYGVETGEDSGEPRDDIQAEEYSGDGNGEMMPSQCLFPDGFDVDEEYAAAALQFDSSGGADESFLQYDAYSPLARQTSVRF